MKSTLNINETLSKRVHVQNDTKILNGCLKNTKITGGFNRTLYTAYLLSESATAKRKDLGHVFENVTTDYTMRLNTPNIKHSFCTNKKIKINNNIRLQYLFRCLRFAIFDMKK
jgi:hypothetical protein